MNPPENITFSHAGCHYRLEPFSVGENPGHRLIGPVPDPEHHALHHPAALNYVMLEGTLARDMIHPDLLAAARAAVERATIRYSQSELDAKVADLANRTVNALLAEEYSHAHNASTEHNRGYNEAIQEAVRIVQEHFNA